MKVYPIHFDDGRSEWCVEYPDLKGCVGGGDTIEEAIADAEATKQVYLDYLKSEGYDLPKPTDESELPSGKIALRVAKTTHKQLLENAKAEGISLNAYIQAAINEKIGTDSTINELKQLLTKIENNIEEVKENQAYLKNTIGQQIPWNENEFSFKAVELKITKGFDA